MYTSPAAVMRTRCGLLPTATCCESFTSCPKATTSALIATIAPNNHGTACTAYNRIRFQGRSEQPLIHLVILYLLSDTSLAIFAHPLEMVKIDPHRMFGDTKVKIASRK